MKLLKKLDQREKDRQELELESVFEDLRRKAEVSKEDQDDDLETLTNMSIQEIKEEKKINIYKPTLKRPAH